MKFCQRLTKRLDQRGVALFIVLTSMATLAIFLGEITYTAQINQKLAYDRLDQVKATALAKSGLRLALLRIRAYSELKKTVSSMAKTAGANADAVNSVVPKEMLEKIWNEPITVPFTGDISSLPTAAQDALGKFRKDSGMEGKLYLSILSQSAKFNLNSYLPAFASQASPTPKPSPGSAGAATPTPSASPSPSGTPIVFDQAQARELLTAQIKETFQRKFDEDEKFRDRYRNLKLEDIADDMMAWNDLSYDSTRAQSAIMPFKKAPFYDISELHYLPTIDDEIYDLLAPAYSTTVESSINVNKILEPTLIALVPMMTVDERKKFFEDRDQSGDSATASPTPNTSDPKDAGGGPFKDTNEFFEYLKKKVAAFNTPTKLQEFKDSLVKRGISIIIEESQFLVHIEATVHQTKRTLEAVVALVPDKPNKPAPDPNQPTTPTQKRSSLKVIQMRFL
jgi:type II secretory pathway component PulK